MISSTYLNEYEFTGMKYVFMYVHNNKWVASKVNLLKYIADIIIFEVIFFALDWVFLVLHKKAMYELK